MGNSLALASCRLAIVLVKGVPPSAVVANCQKVVQTTCNNLNGFHDLGNGRAFAVVRMEAYQVGLSHEPQEAMTDLSIFTDTGWQTDEDFGGYTHNEAADACNGAYFDPNDQNLVWYGEQGANVADDLSGINRVTLNPAYSGLTSNDPSYGGASTIPSDTCQLWEPEQYAPLAVTLFNNNQEVSLVYRTPFNATLQTGGTIAELTFVDDHSAPLGPVDFGPLGGGYIALGKPALLEVPAARVAGTGQYVFVRGSDNGLWMNYNGWQSLGGTFYGDPSAVYWNGGSNVNVFVLGLDGRIYTYGISQGVLQGWAQVPGPDPFYPGTPVNVSGPPKAISKSGSTIDVFAVGVNGALYQMPFNSSSGGWSPTIYWGTMDQSVGLFSNAIGVPVHTPPSITSWGSDELDFVATAESDVAHGRWTASGGYSGYQSIASVLGGSNSPSGTPSIVSWGPNRLDAFMIDRASKLMHAYWDGSWHPDIYNPFASDAVGDPVTISRGSGRVEVFYRTTNGSLSHFIFNAAGWSYQGYVLPANSIP